MNMVQIFGLITEEFTTNESHIGKKVPPILHVDGRISFDFSFFLSNLPNIDLVFLFQYHELLSWFQYIPRNMFPLDFTSLIPIWFKLVYRKIIKRDMITLDTYLNIFHKIENTETHCIHTKYINIIRSKITLFPTRIV